MKSFIKVIEAMMIALVFCMGCVPEEEPSSADIHDYVDLGLPSGTLWAACNVGADAPEAYGDYFAWGETTTKSYYNWINYQHCSEGNYNQMTKYCFDSEFGYNGYTDALTVLQSEDDAATIKWGTGWCMPTLAQWEELYGNTTHSWTTLNDVDGCLFTANNGDSLFLPAAGYRFADELNHEGSYYWSSSLTRLMPGTNDYEGPISAGFLGFSSREVVYGDDAPRNMGFSIRPVRSSN